LNGEDTLIYFFCFKGCIQIHFEKQILYPFLTHLFHALFSNASLILGFFSLAKEKSPPKFEFKF
jgi:hypothetical protein